MMALGTRRRDVEAGRTWQSPRCKLHGDKIFSLRCPLGRGPRVAPGTEKALRRHSRNEGNRQVTLGT